MPKSSKQSFAHEVIFNLGNVPKRGFAVALFAGFFPMAFDGLPQGPSYGISTWTVFVVIASLVVWLVSAYLVVTMMIDLNPSLRSCLLFVVTTLSVFTPIILAVGLASFLPSIIGKQASATIFIFLLLTGLVAVVLLPAWPVAQSASQRFVSPLQLLRAGKGSRWGLIVFSSVVGGTSKWLPPVSSESGWPERGLLIAAHGCTNGGANLLTASVAAAAWLVAVKNDPTLRNA
jgi:hypothetical protein